MPWTRSQRRQPLRPRCKKTPSHALVAWQIAIESSVGPSDLYTRRSSKGAPPPYPHHLSLRHWHIHIPVTVKYNGVLLPAPLFFLHMFFPLKHHPARSFPPMPLFSTSRGLLHWLTRHGPLIQLGTAQPGGASDPGPHGDVDRASLPGGDVTQNKESGLRPGGTIPNMMKP